MALAWGVASTAFAGSGNPDCIDVWGEVRYGSYGYDHVVHIRNRCEAVAECDVSSNVNPTPSRVTVAPKAEAEVLTFRGSPAREFSPRADCRLLS